MRLTACRVFGTIILAFIIATNQGCSGDELTTTTGIVVNSGSFSNGGCEWIIVIGIERFQPDNLPSEFQTTDSLPVEVTYRFVRSTVDCPLQQNYSGVIHLNRIKPI